MKKNKKIEHTTEILKKAAETFKSQTYLSALEKVWLDYQLKIREDVNYPLKNMVFLPKDVELAYLEGLQRDIIASQSRKLAISMKAMGNIRPIIVVRLKFDSNKYKYYVLDGQHNYTALRALDAQEIPIVEVPVKDIPSLVEVIALLNSSSKAWTLKDYVNAWGNIHPDYVTLKNLFDKYDIELSIISAICGGSTVAGSGPGTSLIKSGKFRILNLEESERKLSDITEILNLLPRMDRAANRYFILSLLNVFAEVKYTRQHQARLVAFVSTKREILKFALNNVNELKEFLMQAFA
jgi:uncharacterized ParB-like nuclease family protein